MMILAMDRASVRRTDAQGFLHVDTSPISKANICAYHGSEIPGWRELGLDESRVYHLFRDPEELAKGADTFNNLPLLHTHVPVDADNIPDELIVGTTGSHCAFDGSYLNNSLAVWKRADIRSIEAKRKYQLSSAYRYVADMTPGKYQGLSYDGVMRNIIGNHVAIVFEGRAGPDVVIGDENMKSRAAYMVSGAMAALVSPRLASGQNIDLAVAMDGATVATFTDEGKRKEFAEKIVGLTDGKLAQDQALDADTVINTIGAMAFDAANDEIKEPEPKPEPKPADPKPAEDDPKAVAMDGDAVQRMIADAVSAERDRATARMTAADEVRPVIGQVTCDSADGYYKLALDHMSVKYDGLDPSAYGALFRSAHAERNRAPVAMDAANTSHAADFKTRYPATAHIGRSL